MKHLVSSVPAKKAAPEKLYQVVEFFIQQQPNVIYSYRQTAYAPPETASFTHNCTSITKSLVRDHTPLEAVRCRFNNSTFTGF